MFDKNIFREYDIRGTYGKNIDEDIAFKIGQAFALEFPQGSIIIVGRDGRNSSPSLCTKLIQGLNLSGIEVIDIGIVPTPTLYFACCEFACQGGVMVTGSHNPKDDNGFKFVKNGHSFFGEQIKALYSRILESKFNPETEKASTKSAEVKELYLERILSSIVVPNKDLKIAWDPGNGASGEIITQLVKRIPGKHFIINADINGDFPNHHPDPAVPENLIQLKKEIIRNKCDFGIAFDGDADRIGIVDNTGAILEPDHLLMILAKAVLKENIGCKIIVDVKTSNHVLSLIKAEGGEPIVWKTGHSLIKKKMKEINALFAGEVSGHIFFADRYYGYDDGIYAALRFIEWFSQQNLSLSEIVQTFPKSYYLPETKIPCPDDEKFIVIHNMQNRLDDLSIEYNNIDGIRIDYPDGFLLCRASNTGPALVIRVESNDEKRLLEKKKFLAELIRSCYKDPDLVFDFAPVAQ